ncbi:TPA: phage major capsid protein, partial [Escherichia coli]|nr:phage major capsid protein [Escherichia coli]
AGVLCGATEAADLLSMIETHTANGNSLTTSTLILPVRHAMKLMEYEIEEIKLLGLPLIVSQHAGKVAIINAQKLIINVEGTIIKQSNQTQIKTTEGTSLSLFQNGLTAFRAVTYCGWEVLDNAVTVLREGMTA